MQAVFAFLLFLLLLFCGNKTVAQEVVPSKRKAQNNTYYLAFGTNQSFFSPSNIRFRSSVKPSYDFELYNVRGKDDKGFDFTKGAPQYSYTLGFFSHKNQWGIAFNFDHIKYYIRQNQQVRIKGTIGDKYLETDTVLTPNFVHLEHSDGGNYALLNFMKWKPLLQDKQQYVLTLLLKGGAGPVIPKTNSIIMGKHRDDRYKIAGFVVALESGLRYKFSKLLFAEFDVKGAYANYSRFLIADGLGSQQWFGLHFALLAGVELGR